MNTKIHTNGTYGSVSYTQQPSLHNAKAIHFNTSRNQVAPNSDISEVGSDPVPTLTLSDVKYVVRERVGPWWKGACFRKTRRKTVLRDISVQMKSGEITAILGNSGSGKTSLLDVISCRSSGNVTGKVCYNNIKCTRAVIQQRATYVMQADRLLPNLTVRETLRYTARLKLPGNSSTQHIEEQVSQVILEMGLKSVADSRIGSGIIRGISGGEQRRVTIAIQLLKDPDMILLDEPTSGLDSHTARYLASNLRDLSRRGKIVLLTIHQPNSDLFHLFDQIVIMSHGQMVYCGSATELVPYFTAAGYPCDKYTNPLDRYVDVASIDRRDKEKEIESLKRVGSLVEAFKYSALHRQTLEHVKEATSRPVTASSYNGFKTRKGASYLRVMKTLLSRMNTNLFRDRKDYVARIALLPLYMVFILIFLGRLKHTQSSIQDRIGLLYQSCMVPSFIGIINSVALFVCLRSLYYREGRDGLYGATTFLTTYSIHVIPFHILSSVIFSSIVYWATGMYPEVGRFCVYTLVIFMQQFWGEMLAIACLGIFMSSVQANGVAALLQASSIIIASGLIKNVSSLVEPYQWLSWILIHKYIGEIFVANEFHDLVLECKQNTTEVCIPNGNMYIDAYYPGAVDNMAMNVGIMCAYASGTLIFAIIAFKAGGLKNLQ